MYIAGPKLSLKQIFKESIIDRVRGIETVKYNVLKAQEGKNKRAKTGNRKVSD